MKIHIVQRNDTFESIAGKYDVSVQDLVGMNTHINPQAGLVPGLKVKVPSSARKEESNVTQHIQKYYPNLDTNPIELKTVTTVEPEPVVVKQEVAKPTPQVTEVKEEVVPVPLKPIQTETPTQPNDGVKLGGAVASIEQYNVSVNQKTYQQPKQTTTLTSTQSVTPTQSATPVPAVNQMSPYLNPPIPPMMNLPYAPSCSSAAMPYQVPGMPSYANPYLGTYSPYGVPYSSPYAMRSAEDERFFVGGFGSPFFGGWGWGGYPFFGGWGWGRYPYYGGWGWGRYPYYGG